jgi:ABC-type oligopeptide transport system ATPase subunit
LRRLQEELGLAVVLIAHDLAMVERTAHRVVVMHRGRVVEAGPTEEVFARPAHPYTAELLAAVPRLPPGTWTGEGTGVAAEPRSEANGGVPKADRPADRG